MYYYDCNKVADRRHCLDIETNSESLPYDVVSAG
jgi:hypothetical protein